MRTAFPAAHKQVLLYCMQGKMPTECMPCMYAAFKELCRVHAANMLDIPVTQCLRSDTAALGRLKLQVCSQRLCKQTCAHAVMM